MDIETRSVWRLATACAEDRLITSPRSHHGNAAKLVAFLMTAGVKQAELDGRRRELESRVRCLTYVVASAVRSLLQQVLREWDKANGLMKELLFGDMRANIKALKASQAMQEQLIARADHGAALNCLVAALEDRLSTLIEARVHTTYALDQGEMSYVRLKVAQALPLPPDAQGRIARINLEVVQEVLLSSIRDLCRPFTRDIRAALLDATIGRTDGELRVVLEFVCEAQGFEITSYGFRTDIPAASYRRDESLVDAWAAHMPQPLCSSHRHVIAVKIPIPEPLVVDENATGAVHVFVAVK